MSDELILVLGATGTTGRRLTRRLRAAGVAVRAASRHGETRFDWSDPTTWDAAVTGVTRIYLMAPHELPIDPRFVRRAVEHGVRHIALLSSRGIEAMGDERLMAAERAVRGSGVDWTILRPDWFDQNFDEGFLQPAVMAGGFALPVGETGFAHVDADDIAAVAAAVLTTDGHAGQSYELTGPTRCRSPKLCGSSARRPAARSTSAAPPTTTWHSRRGSASPRSRPGRRSRRSPGCWRKVTSRPPTWSAG